MGNSGYTIIRGLFIQLKDKSFISGGEIDNEWEMSF